MEQTEKIEMITQTEVLNLGFTKSMIEKLLPKPVLKDNPRYKCAAPMKLWVKATVLEVMDTEEYKKMWEAGRARRESAEKAVATKRDKAEKVLDELIASIKIKKISMNKLRDRTFDAQFEFRCERDDSDPYRVYDADEKTLQRWMVNYVRHNLCSYEDDLDEIFGKTGKFDLYTRLKTTILTRIGEIYPELQEECKRQAELTVIS